MAYDEGLAQRLREVLAGEPGLTERSMFGGLAFLLHGHMAVAASSAGGLMVRIDPADAEALTRDPQVSRFQMHGRAMDGWLAVDAAAIGTDEALQRWVDHGVAFVRTMPPK